MGGGNSKTSVTKASEKSDQLEEKISSRQNERYSSRREMREISKSSSKKHQRAKSEATFKNMAYDETNIR